MFKDYSTVLGTKEKLFKLLLIKTFEHQVIINHNIFMSYQKTKKFPTDISLLLIIAMIMTVLF